ncbi:MAG: hypothetical protein AAF639_09000 [Chloroflexota bacterium]
MIAIAYNEGVTSIVTKNVTKMSSGKMKNYFGLDSVIWLSQLIVDGRALTVGWSRCNLATCNLQPYCAIIRMQLATLQPAQGEHDD